MRVTASGIARLAKCQAVAVLPWARIEHAQSAYGTIVHAYLRDVAVKGRDLALLEAPFEHQAALDCIDLAKLPASSPEAWAFEVAFIYDVLKDRAWEVARGADRVEGSGDTYWVTGTSDVVGVTENAVIILDYKTGWYDYGPPEANWQLLVYALAAARTYGKSEAWVGTIRVKENGDSWFEWAKLSSFDLDSAAGRLLELLERVEGIRASGEIPTPNQGGHCKYCPAFDSCPAKRNLAVMVGEGMPGLEVPELTDELVPAILRRIEAAKVVIKRVEAVLKERALTRTVDMGDGWVYGVKEYRERRILPEKALPLLKEAYGQDVADATVEVETSLTKKGLERGLRIHVARTKGAKITHVTREAYKMLEEKQAVRLKVEPRVMLFQPKDELPEGASPKEQPPAAPAPEPAAPEEPDAS